MKRVLITGGAGFIGSHLAEAYLRLGEGQVSVIDDLSTGSLENIGHLLTNRKFSKCFEFVEDTIFNTETLERLIRKSDAVVHLAAAVGVKYIIDNPISSMNINLAGTELLLRVCQRHKKKIFIASTSEVYGKQTHAPLKEADSCVYGPSSKFRWSYAATKLIDEFYALAYFREYGLPVVIGRLFNTVGPRQTGEYGMVIPRFVGQALRNGPITVYDDGSQTRTFAHVSEVVQCIIRLLECPEAWGEVVNIGGIEEVSILQLARRIKEKTNSASEVNCVSYQQMYPRDFEDMRRRVPSTEKLNNLIAYTPQMSLDQILDDIIAYHHTRISPKEEAPKVANL